MRVNVRLGEPLRSKAGFNRATLEIASDQVTMADVLAEMARTYSGIAGEMGRLAGQLDADYCVFHNLRMVRFVDAENELFQDGDELSIYLPLVGG